MSKIAKIWLVILIADLAAIVGVVWVLNRWVTTP